MTGVVVVVVPDEDELVANCSLTWGRVAKVASIASAWAASRATLAPNCFECLRKVASIRSSLCSNRSIATALIGLGAGAGVAGMGVPRVQDHTVFQRFNGANGSVPGAFAFMAAHD